MSADLVELRRTLPGIASEECLGDNLCILLASYFEPGIESDEMDEYDAWKQGAVDASERVLDAIHAHYADRIAALEAEASEGERRGLERAAEVADELASQWVIDASNAKTAEARAYFENRHSAASWVCDRIHALIPAPAREGE